MDDVNSGRRTMSIILQATSGLLWILEIIAGPFLIAVSGASYGKFPVYWLAPVLPACAVLLTYFAFGIARTLTEARFLLWIAGVWLIVQTIALVWIMQVLLKL